MCPTASDTLSASLCVLMRGHLRSRVTTSNSKLPLKTGTLPYFGSNCIQKNRNGNFWTAAVFFWCDSA